MASNIQIISYLNTPYELGMSDILELMVSANQPGVRVDYFEADNFLTLTTDPLTREFFQYGVICLWTGYSTSRDQLFNELLDFIGQISSSPQPQSI